MQHMSQQFVLGFALVSVILAPPAWGIDFTGQSSGTFVTSALDLNGDGIPALRGSSTGPTTAFGVFSSEGIADFTLFIEDLSAAACTMPNGDPGLSFDSTHVSGAARQHETGDAFFLEGSATNCDNLLTCFDAEFNTLPGCTFVSETHWNIVGGTGQFAGATGTVVVMSEGHFTAVSPIGGFGVITNSSVWSVNLADNGNTDCTILDLLGVDCP